MMTSRPPARHVTVTSDPSPVFGVQTAGREGATDGPVYQPLLGHWDSVLAPFLPVDSNLRLLRGALFAETDFYLLTTDM